MDDVAFSLKEAKISSTECLLEGKVVSAVVATYSVRGTSGEATSDTHALVNLRQGKVAISVRTLCC